MFRSVAFFRPSPPPLSLSGRGAIASLRPHAVSSLFSPRFLSSFVIRPSSVILRPSFFVRLLSSIVHRPSSIVHRPSSIVHRPSSFVRRPSSVVLRPSSLVPLLSSLILLTALTLAPARAADPAPHPTFIDDDPEAATRLKTLDDAAAAGHWDRAIDAAQALLENPGRLALDADGVFRPAGAVVAARLAAWPKEGRDAFASRVTPAAEERWRHAAGPDDWTAIADRAPGTPVAARALERLTRAASAEGDWALAARSARLRLAIPEPPSSVAFHALSAFVATRAGRSPTTIPNEFATAAVASGPASPSLGEFATLLQRAAAPPPNPPEAALAKPVFEAGVTAWPPRALREKDPAEDKSARQRRGMRVGGGMFFIDEYGESVVRVPTVVSTACDEDMLYINNGGALVAVRRATGEIAWQCAREGTSVEFPPGCDAARFQFHVALAGPLVVATRPEGLVACHRNTGGVAWTLKPDSLADESRKRALFASAPLVANGACFVAAFLPDKAGTATWLVRLDPLTGAVAWWRFVCSVDKPGEPGWNTRGDVRGNAALAFSAADGFVLCVPTQGVVSAHAMETGTCVWLRPYDPWSLQYNESPPAGPSTAFLKGGTLYTHPVDGRAILALDPATGASRWPPQKVRWRCFCCGLSDNRLFLQGDKINAYDLSNGDLVDNWVHGSALITGAAHVSDGVLYIPTDRGIFAAPASDLAHPKTLVSAPKEEPLEGSIVRSGPLLYLVSPTEVRAYTGEADRRRLLTQRLAKHPEDAALRFAYASLLTTPAERAEAIESYRAAWKNASPDLLVEGVAVREAARDRLRRLLFAEARHLSEIRDPSAAARFGEARAVCTGAEEHLEIALPQIEEAELRDDWPAAIAIEQDLLSRFGGALHRFETPGPELPVRLWAKGRIRRTIEKHGRILYRPFADRALAAERIGPILGFRPAALAWQIGETYPFSPSARRACATLVESAAAAGEWREAEAWADRYLLRYPDGSYAPRAALRAAEALAASGSPERARAAYRRAAERFPTAVIPGDGSPSTPPPHGWRTGIAKIVESRLASLPVRPASDPPPSSIPALRVAWSWSAGKGESVELVRAPGGRGLDPSTGRLVLLLRDENHPVADRLRALRAPDGTTLWEASVPNCAAATYEATAEGPSDTIIATGEGFVSAFEAGTGRLLWTRRTNGRAAGDDLGLGDPPPASNSGGGIIVASSQYAVMGEGGNSVTALDLPGRSRVASLNTMGSGIYALDLALPENLVLASGGPGSFFVAYDMERAAATFVRPNGPSTWLCTDGTLYLAYTNWWESRVEAVDAKTGKSRWRTALPALWSGWGWWRGWNESPGNETLVLDGGRMWVASGEQLHAIDLAQGRLRWSRPIKGANEGVHAIGLLGDSIWAVAGGEAGVIVSAFDREKGELRWDRVLPPGEARSARVFGGTLAVLSESNGEARSESLTLLDGATGVPTAGALDPQPTAWYGELVVSGATLCRVAARRIDAWAAGAPAEGGGEMKRLEDKAAAAPEDIDTRIALTAALCTAGRFAEALESARKGLAIAGLETDSRSALWACQETARGGLFVAAPPEWPAQRLATSPKIDGTLDEWVSLRSIRLEEFVSVQAQTPIPDSETPPWSGPEDGSATAWLGWDEEALYLAAEVTDDAQDLGGALISEGDSIRFWLAPPAETGEAKRRPVAGEVAAITLAVPEPQAAPAPTKEGETSEAAPGADVEAARFTEGNAKEETPLAMDEIKASAARAADGNTTRYEARIPWKVLPKRARGKAGATYRIAFAVIDRDGGQLQNALKWTPIPWEIAGPVRFGTARLEP